MGGGAPGHFFLVFSPRFVDGQDTVDWCYKNSPCWFFVCGVLGHAAF